MRISCFYSLYYTHDLVNIMYVYSLNIILFKYVHHPSIMKKLGYLYTCPYDNGI